MGGGNNVFLKISYLNFKDSATLSIFLNVGSQQRNNAGHPKGKEQLPLSLEGKSTAREPHIALPFSYILQNKFYPCECRSDITLINIFPCRYIPRGAVFANICPKIYILLFQVIFQDERCLWTFRWIYGKIESFLYYINIIVLHFSW